MQVYSITRHTSSAVNTHTYCMALHYDNRNEDFNHPVQPVANQQLHLVSTNRTAVIYGLMLSIKSFNKKKISMLTTNMYLLSLYGHSVNVRPMKELSFGYAGFGY